MRIVMTDAQKTTLAGLCAALGTAIEAAGWAPRGLATAILAIVAFALGVWCTQRGPGGPSQ